MPQPADSRKKNKHIKSNECSLTILNTKPTVIETKLTGTWIIGGTVEKNEMIFY